MQGRAFGDFVLKERLGAGGGGEVYRAEQVTLAREAVVKVMTHHDQTEAAERFLREARLASQLDHPFAAHIYGFGHEADGVLWIAMELVRGTSLEHLVRDNGTVPLARFVPFFERLCEVIHAAHEQGIVHRDIKPANVMVINRAGRMLPKLLDLGIARRGNESAETAESVSGLTPHDNLSPLDLTDTQARNTAGAAALHNTTIAERLTQSETMNLTRVGALVGTPHYMAPEQWADASSAGVRADLYSLALLAYRVLVGKMPFEAKSLRQLAKAHASTPLPPLPDTLPAALYPVLAQGAAKDPNQRYATAIEFAAALRAASGIGVEPLALPQLEEGLRENLLSEAPQPLAESVALLESARTPTQQLEALWGVRRVVVRHLALLALAARARVGPGQAEDSLAFVTGLRALATTGLNDRGWLELAKDVCRPFAFRKAAHPLPELVAFFFGDSDADAGSGVRALEELDALGQPPAKAADEVVHAALLRLVPALGRVLQNLAFIFDYPLVVQRETPERWMGTRRNRRLTQATASALPQGVPVMLDSVGLPVLTLAPLMQVFTPGGSLPEECFYLDGAGRHGARLVALPSPFERQSEEVWPWFSANIFDVTAAQGASAATEAPPYKGLSTFTAEDADNYFGRETEAQLFANRLRSSALLAVVGPSGTGKSSFVLAGVLPLLPKTWRAKVMRPGAAPFEALAAKLNLPRDRANAAGVVSSLAEGETLVLVVDQFEELVTLCQDPQERQEFAQMLVGLADGQGGRVRVVLTVRDDFLIKVQQLRALRERLSLALQLLGTPAREELMRVVTQPAARVGYGFDDPTLPAKMVDEVAEYPGALALLSFASSMLWELRDRHLRQMRAKTYEALGGVGGALAHHAEATLAQMNEAEGKLVREAFRHLVTSQSTRAVMSRSDMLDVLGGLPSAHSVLEKLVTARLLVTSEDATGDDRVEIIHEALIVSWPRLVGWLREDAETARLRDSLRASAKQWADRNKASGLLWRKETLAEYRVWRARFPGKLTQLEEAFAAASLREEARSRNIRRALAATAFAVLAVGLVVVFRAYQRADASAVEARHRLLTLRQEQGRLALLDQKPLEALAYLEAGRPDQPSAAFEHLEWYAGWLARGREAVYRGAAPLSEVVISPNEKQVAAFSLAGEGVRVDLETGATRPLPQGLGVFVDNERLWVTARESYILEVSETERRKIETGHLLWSLHPSAPDHWGVRMAPTGAALDSFTAVVLLKNEPMVVLKTPPVTTLASFWSPDSRWVVTFAGPGSVESGTYRGLSVYDVQAKKVVGHHLADDVIRTVTFAENGDVLTGAASGALRRMGTDGHLSWKTDLSVMVDDLSFNPGKTLLAARARGSVVFVAPDTGKVVQSVALSSDTLSTGRWSDDTYFLAGQQRGDVVKLDATTGETWWTFYGATQASADAAPFAQGRRLAVASNDSTLSLFDNTVTPAPELKRGALLVWASPSQPDVYYATAQGVFDLKTQEPAIDRYQPEGTELAGAVRGDRVAISDAHSVVVADRAQRKLLAKVAIETAAYELWFDPTATHLGVCLFDGRTAIVDVARAELRYLPPHRTQCNRGEFSADGRTLLLGTDIGSILVYRFPELVLEKELEDHNNGTFVHEGPNPNQWLTLGWDGAVALWSQNPVARLATIEGITGNSKWIVNARLEDGLLSLYLGSGEWLTIDWATNTLLSKYRMPFKLKSLAMPSQSHDAFAVTEDGTLRRVPFSRRTADVGQPHCATPYAIEGNKLVVQKEKLMCTR